MHIPTSTLLRKSLLQLSPARHSRAVGDGKPPVAARPCVRGKFLFAHERKFWVKGVTYGTFAPRQDGAPFPPPEQIERDFAAMAPAGINAVRVYTPPPRALLVAASRHGLFVMVGLPWEQHVAFLDDAR